MIFKANPIPPLEMPRASSAPIAPSVDAWPPAQADEDERDAGARERLARASVLIVDDEPANVRLLTRILVRAGCRTVIGTTDPAEGVRLYVDRQPDLLLLDLRMPGMDGLEVLERLRECRADRTLSPVLVLTADGRVESREAALAQGANDLVAKPFDLAGVLRRVDGLLETSFPYRALARENEVLEQAVAERTAALRQEVARRERAERERDAAEDRQRHLLESISDPVVRTDARGIIRYANPAAARLVGVAPGALEGLSVLRLVAPRTRRAARRFYRAQLRTGEPATRQEVPTVTADGRELRLDVDVSMHRGPDGAFTAQAVARDLTPPPGVEHIKDHFLALASHELRTPLTSIRAALGLLESGLMDTQPERARHTLRIATRNSERLARLLSDMLDLDRLDSGAARLQRRPQEVCGVMTLAAASVQADAEAAGVLLVVVPAEGTAVMDGERIGQVLAHLLGNAVKFSSAGGTVWLSAAADAEGVTFTVRDQGRGIPADKLDAVFHRFTQVDASDARDRGGPGLGLALARTIVEQHGGRILVESRAGAGSTFTVRLPA